MLSHLPLGNFIRTLYSSHQPTGVARVGGRSQNGLGGPLSRIAHTVLKNLRCCNNICPTKDVLESTKYPNFLCNRISWGVERGVHPQAPLPRLPLLFGDKAPIYQQVQMHCEVRIIRAFLPHPSGN